MKIEPLFTSACHRRRYTSHRLAYLLLQFASRVPNNELANSSVCAPTPGEHNGAPYGAWEDEMEKTERICINESTFRFTSHTLYSNGSSLSLGTAIGTSVVAERSRPITLEVSRLSALLTRLAYHRCCAGTTSWKIRRFAVASPVTFK